MRFQAADGFQAAYCLPIRQPETFAKPVTNGASAARRHGSKPVMLCLKRWRRAAAVPF